MNTALRLASALLLSFCLPIAFCFGQGKISGRVIDRSSGEPLSFCNVFIPKSQFGIRTDEKGSFTIEKVPAGTYTVVASILGYNKQEKQVSLADQQTLSLDFDLAEDTIADEVIVTGTVNPRQSLQSSISISTLKGDQIAQSAPRSTAEILRSIPGIRSEASAGDGNTNITVRGVPIATGGSKFLLLQEDGLPVLQF